MFFRCQECLDRFQIGVKIYKLEIKSAEIKA